MQVGTFNEKKNVLIIFLFLNSTIHFQVCDLYTSLTWLPTTVPSIFNKAKQLFANNTIHYGIYCAHNLSYYPGTGVLANCFISNIVQIVCT